jgi:Uma2 family endonuclease
MGIADYGGRLCRPTDVTMLLEITSQSTRTVDLNRKRREYYRAHVPLYVIVDELPNREEDGPRDLCIIGYRRGTRRYERLELN